MEVVASLSQGRTAAAQCGLFTHKSVPVIFEPPCIIESGCVLMYASFTPEEQTQNKREIHVCQAGTRGHQRLSNAHYAGSSSRYVNTLIISAAQPVNKAEHLYHFHLDTKF